MGIISKFGSWITRIFVPDIPMIMIPPRPSPAEPAQQEFLTAREGAVLVKEEGVAVLYPPDGTDGVDDRILDTLDFLRHALARPDWMDEWFMIRDELEEDDWEDDDEENLPPVLTLLDGGREDEQHEEPEPGPFAARGEKDPPLSE